MSSDRDLNDPGNEPEEARPEKETAPPPPLFDATDEATRVMDSTKELLSTRKDAGLRQMFSRDPAPVRDALPTADEGDALLDMLFEDAKGDRSSAEPPVDEETMLRAPPVDDMATTVFRAPVIPEPDQPPPSARAAPPPLPPPARSAPGISAPPRPPPRPGAPPRPPPAPSRQPPLPAAAAPPPPPRAPVRVEDKTPDPRARSGDSREELETLDADDERVSADRISADRVSAPAHEPKVDRGRAPDPARVSDDVIDLDAPLPEDEGNFDATEIQERPEMPSNAPIRPSHPPAALALEHGEDASAQLARNKQHDAWAVRAAWLREEAQAETDRALRSRGMLVVSELCAMIGDEQNARAAAAEARELAPTSPLPHRQVRGLLARQGEWPGVLDEIEGEGKSVSTPAARCHLALFGAEIARIGLNDAEQARRRLELALRILPSDPRSHLQRIAAALVSHDAAPADADAAEGAALQKIKLPDAEDLAPVADAMATLLAYRGLAPKTRAPTTPYESVLRARAELSESDAGRSAAALEHLLGVLAAESLGGGAGWLIASLAAPRKETRPRAVERLRALLDGSHASLARRSLAARAIELGDAEAAKTAIDPGGIDPRSRSVDEEGGGAFTPGDRVALSALAGGSRADVETWQEPLWNDEELAPIAAAIDALEPASAERIPRAIGTAQNRAGVTLGRTLASGALGPIADAVGLYADAVQGTGVDSALTLELFAATGAGGKIATLVAGWREDAELEQERLLAAALIAEVSGESQRAQDEFEKIRASEAALEAAARARLPHVDDAAAAEMLAELAGAMEPGTRAALLLTEAAIRVSDDADKADVLLRKAAELDPKLPFPPHLGERAARARGDRDGLVEWLRTRREGSDDPVEQAHDLVREALLLSDADGAPATGLLEAALRARPADVGLRELYERLSPEPPADRGAWRLARAKETQGGADAARSAESARLALEAAFEFERARDWEKVAEASRLALAAGDTTLAPILAYRAALNGQGAGDVIDGLLPRARQTDDTHERLEIYERLADLDELGRADAASGLLWRRTILEETPGHLPTLRRVASALVSAGRDDDLEPVALDIAKALDGLESVAHAMVASRLRIKATSWDDTREAVEVGYRYMPRTIWALRQMEAHARARNDHELALEVDRQLIERTQRPSEAATLALRAAQSATKAGMPDDALAFLAHAIELVPNHLVAHLELARALDQSGNAAGAAASLEAAAAASAGPNERAQDLYRAALLWQDKVNDAGRARHALEQVAELDPSYADVFDRLQAIYVAAGARAELARLLERRLDAVSDPRERVEMEVLRGRALADVGDAAAAKRALAAALEANPDHVEALAAYAEVASGEQDWGGAEQAWIRLARLVSDPARQADIYLKLGDLYDRHIPNAERAELAYNEILKRAPDDARPRERLVALFQRGGDHARALEQQTILINGAQTIEDKCLRTTELAKIHEMAGDVKKAEATLLQARKTWPKDDVALAALARFYHRNKQEPAAQVLLDRAVADARRALATGRFESYLFSTVATVAALRNKPDAARIAQAAVASLEGNPADVDGAGGRAGDVRLDDLLAPEVMNGAFRELVRRTGQLLDAAMPFDLTSIRATPLPPQQRELNDFVRALGQAYGLPAMNVYTSSALGQVCIPVSAYPPAVVLGQALVASSRDDVRGFLVHRALKTLQTNASALSRTAPIDLWPLLAAYLKALNPNWSPQGVDQGKLTEFYGRIARGMQGPADPQVGALASEVIGTLGNRASTLNTVINGWGNRAALLATGDLNIAMVGIAWSGGHAAGPPGAGKDRVTWIGRNAEARELVVFSVSDGYADARARVGLGVPG